MKNKTKKTPLTQNTLLTPEQEEKIICQLFDKESKGVFSALKQLCLSQWSQTIATHLLGCYAFHHDLKISEQALELLQKNYPEYYELSKKVPRPRFRLDTPAKFFVEFLAPLQEQGAALKNDFQLIYEWGNFSVPSADRGYYQNDYKETKIFEAANQPKNYFTSVVYSHFRDGGPAQGGFKIHPEKIEIFSADKDLTLLGSLKTLPKGIGNLQGLEELRLVSCSNLRSLPDTLTNLKNLRYLSFQGCSKLEILPAFKTWKKLEVLDLRGCKSLKSLPRIFDSLPKLKVFLDYSNALRLLSGPALHPIQSLELDFHPGSSGSSDDTAIRELLNLLKSFPNLENLSITVSKMQNLPVEVVQLKKLRFLKLCVCSSLQSKGLSEAFSQLKNLRSLKIQECLLMSDLPSEVGELAQLEELELMHMKNLKSLPTTLGKLKNLRKLRFSNLDKLEALPDEISQFKNLQEVSLNYCKSLKELPVQIGEWENIESFYVYGVPLTYLPNEIGQWKKIKKLTLTYVPIKNLPNSVENWKELKHIEIYGNSLKELPAGIKNFQNLEHFRWANSYSSLPAELGTWRKLKYMEISSESLSSLPKEIGQLENLEELHLGESLGIKSIPEEIVNLKKICSFSMKRGIEKIFPVEFLQGIKKRGGEVNFYY